MAQVIVRNLEDDVKAKLKRRAKQHGRSMEDEVRHILRNATKSANRAAPNLGTRIASRFRKIGLDRDLPRLRGQPASPATFDE